MNEVLKQAMAQKGFTPVKLAAALEDDGCPTSPLTINRWLKGANQPRLAHAEALCRVLGIPAEELLAACRPAADTKSETAS